MPGPASSQGTAVGRSRYWSLSWYWGPVVLYMLMIYAVSAMPSLPDIPGGFSDKTAHFSEYALFGLLLARALAGPRWLSISLPFAIGAFAIAALYGISDEFHQLFVPGRDFDVKDMGADALGACASAGALWVWGIIRRTSAVRSNHDVSKPVRSRLP